MSTVLSGPQMAKDILCMLVKVSQTSLAPLVFPSQYQLVPVRKKRYSSFTYESLRMPWVYFPFILGLL